MQTKARRVIHTCVIVIALAMGSVLLAGNTFAGEVVSVQAVDADPNLVPLFRPGVDGPALRPTHPPLDQIPPIPMPFPGDQPAPGPGAPVFHDAVTGETTMSPYDAELLGVFDQGGGYNGADGGAGGGEATPATFLDMTLVGTTGSYPWRMNCKLAMRFEDAGGGSHWYVGSGTMRDAETVLTAGHCVWDNSHGYGWAKEIYVYPGWDGNGNIIPPDSTMNEYGWGRGTYFGSWTTWTVDANFDGDVGLICITRGVGMLTGWFGWAYGGDCSWHTSQTYHNASYPAEGCPDAGLHNGRDMYYWYGNFDSCPGNQLRLNTGGGHCFDTVWGGMSGSGAYYIDGDSRYVHAICSTSDRMWVGNYCRQWEAWVNWSNDTFIPDCRGSSFDLQALDANAGPTTIVAGDKTTLLNVLMTNPTNGTASGDWTFRIYLSDNDNISTSDTLLSTQFYNWSYAAMQSVRVNCVQVTIPVNTPAGDYWIGMILDSATDGNSGNNDTDGWDAAPIHVNAGPTICRSPSSLSNSCTEGSNAPSQSFEVWNCGGGTLDYGISDNRTWMSCNPADGTSVDEHDTITVNYSTSGLAAGSYSGTITISGVATNSPQTIAVDLTVDPAPPTICRSPTSLSNSCTEGSNAPSQSFHVWNCGGNTLNYSISDNQTWLSCNPTSGSSTGEHDTIAVNYATSGLAAGSYSATITISDPAATNTPQTIGVSLTVGACPLPPTPGNPDPADAATDVPLDADLWWEVGPGPGLLYAIRDSFDGTYVIDINTGAPTLIGPSAVTSATCGLSHSGGAVLYGSIWYQMSVIQTDGSGAATLGNQGMEGMAYDVQNGTLYAELNGDFFTVDPATGNRLTTLAPCDDCEGLAFDPTTGYYQRGSVFGISGWSAATPGLLYRYDVALDTWSLVGDTGLGNASVESGLAYAPDLDVLFHITKETGALYRIDKNTAVATFIASTGIEGYDGFSGLAYGPGPAPRVSKSAWGDWRPGPAAKPGVSSNQKRTNVSRSSAAVKASPALATSTVPPGFTIVNGALVEGEAEPQILTAGAVPRRSLSGWIAGATLINFDDVTAPCVFISTVRLTNEYAALGVIFQGPGGKDGGAILDECGNFGVSGHSSPNFLAFNLGSPLSDGGIPQGPETLHFTPTVSSVEVLGAHGSGASGQLTLDAYNAGGVLVDTATITLSSVLSPIAVSASGITRVVISSTAYVFVIDDLTFGPEDECPTTFDVYFGTDPQAMSLICQDLTGPPCDPGTLNAGTTYYWQVVAKNCCGETWGPVWSFTTAGGAPDIHIDPTTVTFDCNPPAIAPKPKGEGPIVPIYIDGRPPVGWVPRGVALPKTDIARGINVLPNVPAFDWCYGCSATSDAMMMGYYDRTGYPNMYTGPAGGGVCPLDNTTWGAGECPLSASHLGYDGRAVKGHVDDYWITYGDCGPDPWIGNWPEHTPWPDCTADAMGTNQSAHESCDGGTWFYWYTNGDPLYDYIAPSPRIDGCHGMRVYAETCGYTVLENFTQLILGMGTDPSKGFSFEDYIVEIDAGRPVMIQIEGHTMVGVGYDDSSYTIYIHNTWDHSTYTMTWGGTYSSMQHQAVTVIRLEPTGLQDTFTIFNQGAGVLDVTSLPYTKPWLSSLSPTAPFSINPGGQQAVTVTVNCDLVPDGGDTDTIDVFSNDPDENPYPGGVTVIVNKAGECTLTMAVSPAGAGTTTPPVGPHVYDCETLVNINATANAGWDFDHWDGDVIDPATQASNRVLVDSDKTVTAVFEPEPVPECTLTMAVNPAGAGTTTPPVGPHVYDCGTLVNIDAAANAGWLFDHWDGDVLGSPTQAPNSVLVDIDKTVTAVFTPEPTECTLTMAVSPVGAGTTTPPVGPHVYDCGTLVDIDATANAGWSFNHWDGDVLDPPTQASNSVLVDTDKTVTAVFCQWLEPARTHSPEYVADSFFDVFIEIQYDGELTGLSLVEYIPPGWSFVEVLSVDGTLLIEPPPGTEDTLEFLWDTLGGPAPPSPVHMTYRLQTVGVAEDHVVSFTGIVGFSWNAHTCEVAVPETTAIEVVCTYHSSDYNPADWHFNVMEIMRLIALYRADPNHEYYCDPAGPDGYNPGPGPQDCRPHSSDYRNGPDWHFDVMEIMRLIAMYKADPNHEYHCDPEGPDGYNPGPPPAVVMAQGDIEPAPFQQTFTVARSHGDYTPAGEFAVTLTFTYDVPAPWTANGLSLIEQTPAGWTFNRVESVDGSLLIEPLPGDEGTMQFLWNTISDPVPPSPVTMTYVLDVPGGELGNREITGTGYLAYDATPLEATVQPDPDIVYHEFAPRPFGLLGPADETCYSWDRVEATLQWNASVPDVPDQAPDSYRVFLDTDGSIPPDDIAGDVVAPTTELVVPIAGNEAYGWSVLARNSYGERRCTDVYWDFFVLGIDPPLWDFGLVNVGGSSVKTFTVYNTSNVAQSGLVADLDPPFSDVAGSPYVILAGDSATIDLSYDPTGPGVHSDTAVFTFDACDDGSGAVPLLGHTPAQLTVLPDPTLEFGSVSIFGPGKVDCFTVTNVGGEATGVGEIQGLAAPFTLESGSPYDLDPAQSTDVCIRFAPVDLLEYSHTVTFTGDPSGSIPRGVHGTGVTCNLSITPDPMGFGDVLVGKSPEMVFTLTNVGADPITGAVTGLAPPFELIAGSSYSLAPAESTTATVRFSPTLRADFADQAEFSGDPVCDPILIDVTGKGVAPDLDITPPVDLDFGEVGVGQTLDLDFTATNTGDAAGELTVTGLAAPFSVQAISDTDLDPAEVVTVTVRYAPTAHGIDQQTATFTITWDDFIDVQRTVSGHTPAELTVVPDPLDFGPVVINTISDLSFTVTNVGGSALSGDASGLGAPFSFVGDTHYDLAALGGTDTVSVRFAPVALGPFADSADFSGDPGGVISRDVMGDCILMPLDVVAQSTSSILLTWTAPFADEDGWKVERRDGPADPWTEVASLPAGTATHLDEGLPMASYFEYRVNGWRGAQNRYSEVSGTSTWPYPPNRPLVEGSYSDAKGYYCLVGIDIDGNPAGVRYAIGVYDPGTGTDIAYLTRDWNRVPTEPAWDDLFRWDEHGEDRNLDPNTEYCYRTYAYSDGDPFSQGFPPKAVKNPNASTVVSDTTPLVPPDDFALEGATGTTATLNWTWDPANGDPDGFRLRLFALGIQVRSEHVPDGDARSYTWTGLDEDKVYETDIASVKDNTLGQFTPRLAFGTSPLTPVDVTLEAVPDTKPLSMLANWMYEGAHATLLELEYGEVVGGIVPAWHRVTSDIDIGPGAYTLVDGQDGVELKYNTRYRVQVRSKLDPIANPEYENVAPSDWRESNDRCTLAQWPAEVLLTGGYDGDYYCEVTWDCSADNPVGTEYDKYRRTYDDGTGLWSSWQLLATETEAGAPIVETDGGLAGATNYQYRVVAKNCDGIESPAVDSNEHRTPPGAPVNLRATNIELENSTARATLDWDASPGDPTGYAASYEVRHSTECGGGTWADMGLPPVTVTGLTPDAKYWVSVRALNADGESGAASDDAADSSWLTTPPGPPDPDSVQVETDTSDGTRLEVSWNGAGVDCEGGFLVQWRVSGEVGWSISNEIPANEESYGIEGLTPSTLYEVQVSSLGLSSDRSNPDHPDPDAGCNNGHNIAGAGQVAPSDWAPDPPAEGLTYIDPNWTIEASADYDRANPAGGNNYFTRLTIGGASNPPDTLYEIEERHWLYGESDWSDWAPVSSEVAGEIIFPDKAPDSRYQYQAKPDWVGIDSVEWKETGEEDAQTPPGPPKDLSAAFVERDAPATANLEWVPWLESPQDAGWYNTPARYEVSYRAYDEAAAGWLAWDSVVVEPEQPANAVTHVLENLDRDELYQWRIRGANEETAPDVWNWGAWREFYPDPPVDPANPTYGWFATPPTAPSDVTVAVPADVEDCDTLEVSWTDNALWEGGFLVQYRTLDIIWDWIDGAQVGANETSATIDNLAPNTAYSVRVMAIGLAAGETNPDLPVADADNTGVVVEGSEWAPDDQGTPPVNTRAQIPGLWVYGMYDAIRDYHMRLSVDPKLNPYDTQFAVFCVTRAEWVLPDLGGSVDPYWSPALSWYDDILVAGEQYAYQIMARNADGLETPLSGEFSGTTPPPPPTNLTAVNVGADFAEVSWSDPSGYWPAGSLTFELSYGPSTDLTGTTIQVGTMYQYILVGLWPGTEYWWTVRASDVNGPGAYAFRQALVTPIIDADGDGLPDDWEQQIIDADPDDDIESIWDVLPGDDFDGDGQSNRNEWLSRTDPTDPTSLLEITDVEVHAPSGAVIVTWSSVPDMLYAVLYADAPDAADWTVAAEHVWASDYTRAWVDSTLPLAETRYYRVALDAHRDVYTEPPGAAMRVLVPEGAWDLISPAVILADQRLDGELGQQLANGLRGGTSAVLADELWYYDPSTDEWQWFWLIDNYHPDYNGRWWDSATGDFATFELPPNGAFYVNCKDGSGDRMVTFAGLCDRFGVAARYIYSGVNLVGGPFGAGVPLQGAGFYESGAKAGPDAEHADIFWVLDPLSPDGWRMLWLMDESLGPDLEGKWYDATADEVSDLMLLPGEGYLYEHCGEGFEWQAGI